MKKLFQSLVIAVLLFLPYSVQAEEITDFRDSITVQADGSFTVKENILYDFGTLERHGIYRTIPFTKTNTQGDVYKLDISRVSVTDKPDVPYLFAKTTDENALTLKIGAANTLVTGEKNYVITYDVSGGLTYFSDHDELYWQVTGTDWTIPIAQASAIVTLPVSDDSVNVQATCFTGTKESTVSDCEVSHQGNQVTATVTRALSPGEGFTVVVGFPKGVVAVLEPQKVVPWSSTLMGKIISILLVIGAFLWYIGLPVWIVVHWFRAGRDPKPPMGEAKAWFDVPKTPSLRPLTPGETGTLLDENADMRDITATIIDLARRGYLKIVETKKNDFTLEKQKIPKDEHLEPFEKLLYDGIFEKKDSVRLKDANLASNVDKTKKALYESVVKEKFFDKNPQTTRTIYIVLGVFGIFTLNFPLILAAFIFGRVMPKKTMLGSQTAAVGRSLKNFITSQDRQFTYQAKKQLLFEKFLPYAIAFGVEKIWAERFKDIRLTEPDWYDGYGHNAFTSIYFINSLNSSMHSVAAAATPTSSSSGFSSGFSGGSVGGGGGGGGGGSW